MTLGGKLLGRLATIGATLMVIGLATDASAVTRTKAIGNPDGTPFSFNCPAGQALIGWNYNATDHLTLIAPMCQNVEGVGDTATVVGAPPGSPDTGFGATDPAAKSGSPIICPDNGVMHSLSVFLTETLRVHHIRATCQAMKHATVIIKSTATSGGTSTGSSVVKCETRTSYATGIFGTYSPSLSKGGIMSLGLNCLSGDEPQQDTAKADTGGDDDQGNGGDAGQGNGGNGDNGNGRQANANDGGDEFGDFPFQLEINIGPGNNGLSFGPKGKSRVLKDASTLYADKGGTEIAYFDKGDKVVVVGCENNGKGWCQVIKPQAGLIWGGDLK